MVQVVPVLQAEPKGGHRAVDMVRRGQLVTVFAAGPLSGRAGGGAAAHMILECTQAGTMRQPRSGRIGQRLVLGTSLNEVLSPSTGSQIEVEETSPTASNFLSSFL
jgi:hypothetical protein